MSGGTPPKPVTGSDILEYLQAKDDFAFERQIYHMAHGLKLAEVEHAGLYEDPVTNKTRQFDIRCRQKIGTDQIELAIECKALSQVFPLVVSCVPRTPMEAHHEILVNQTVAYGYAGTVQTRRIRAGATPTYMYAAGEPVGKSMKQVRRETRGERRGEMIGGDEVFDKWTQALASLAELITRGYETLPIPIVDAPHRLAFLPVLVVPEGTLWVADYSSRGDLKQEPFLVDDITLYLGRKYELGTEKLNLAVTHLHVLTRRSVGSFLEGIARGGGIWQELFPSS